MMPLTMAGEGEVNTIIKVGGKEDTRRSKWFLMVYHCSGINELLRFET